MTTTVVVATVGCENGHLTEVLYISPVVNADDSVDGLLGSSADFCQACEKPAEVLGATLAERTLSPDSVSIHQVKYASKEETA